MSRKISLDADAGRRPGASAPVWPVWELKGHGTAAHGTAGHAEDLPPWLNVRLMFADGSSVEVLAVVRGGSLAVEDLRADPALPLGDLPALAERLNAPLEEACRAASGQAHDAHRVPAAAEMEPRPRRARPAPPRGHAARRVAADAYLAAQRAGGDPVLAVMCATGRSRRRSLKLIAGARDEGRLAPGHGGRRRARRAS